MILSGVEEQSTRRGGLLPENEPAIDQCEYVIGKCDDTVLHKLAAAMTIADATGSAAAEDDSGPKSSYSNASSTDSLKLAVTCGTVGGICADGVRCR